MALSRSHIVLIGGDGSPSGVPRHITDLVCALRDEVKITVISETDQGGYSKIIEAGADHVEMTGLRSTRSISFFSQGMQALEAELLRLKPDLIWSHARMPGMMLRYLSARGNLDSLVGTRLAMSIHGLPYGHGHRFKDRVIARLSEMWFFARCAPLDVVFLTKAQERRARRAMWPWMRRHRRHVLCNTSQLGPFDGPALDRPHGRHIVMTGRVAHQKNYDAALRLMRHLPDDITLSLCGAGTEDDSFKAQVDDLAGPAAIRVRLLGPLKDVRPLLASADAYMLTSRYEGLPIGALEASEYGLPIILSNFTGADMLCKNHPCAVKLLGGNARKAASIDALLDRYLADRNAYRDKIKAFWAAHYDPKSFAQNAKELLQKLLSE